MSQHDFDITTADANTGLTMRAAINEALQALASNNSGIAPPATPYAYMFWVDTSTSTPTLKQRDGTNTVWVSLFQLSSAQWLFVNDILINGVTVGLGGGGINTNSCFGRNSLSSNTTGARNTAHGDASLRNNQTGNSNSAFGTSALINSISGSVSSAFGYQSLYNITTGSGNCAFGYASGVNIIGGGSNQTSGNSVYIGNSTRASANGNTNEIVIGGQADGSGSNTVTLGNNSIVTTILKGTLKLNTVPAAHADNAAAIAAGHVAGEIYRTATGVLMVVY
jgi:hypothetical protein